MKAYVLTFIAFVFAIAVITNYAVAATCPSGFTFSPSFNKCGRVWNPNVNNSNGGMSLSDENSGKKAMLRCAVFKEAGFWTCADGTNCTKNGDSVKQWKAVNCITMSSALPGTPWTRRCDLRPTYTSADPQAFNGYWGYYKEGEFTAGYAPYVGGQAPSTNWTRLCNFTYPNQGDGFGTGAFFTAINPS